MMIGWLCLKGMTVEYLAPGAAGFFFFYLLLLHTFCQDFCEASTELSGSLLEQSCVGKSSVPIAQGYSSAS